MMAPPSWSVVAESCMITVWDGGLEMGLKSEGPRVAGGAKRKFPYVFA